MFQVIFNHITQICFFKSSATFYAITNGENVSNTIITTSTLTERSGSVRKWNIDSNMKINFGSCDH